jgi:hypothetical protein
MNTKCTMRYQFIHVVMMADLIMAGDQSGWTDFSSAVIAET